MRKMSLMRQEAKNFWMLCALKLSWIRISHLRLPAEPSEDLFRLPITYFFADPYFGFAFLPGQVTGAARHRISNIIVAPTRAVMPLVSEGGAASTTSPPMQRPKIARKSKELCSRCPQSLRRRMSLWWPDCRLWMLLDYCS